MVAPLRDGWTVGIPTFNRYHLLKQALASAENQTHKPAEIIVSDNCSTDQTDTASILDSSIRFRYFRHSEPVPPLENFRNALAMCETEYFSWLQDDDYLFPGTGGAFNNAFALNAQAVAVIGYAYHARDINRIRANQTTLWGPPAFQMDFDRGTPMEVPVGCLVPWLTFFWPGFSPVAAFKTQALLEVMNVLPDFQGCSSYLVEQYIIAMLNKLGSIVYLPSVLGVLRDHTSRVTGSTHYDPEVWHAAWLELYSYLAELMPKDTSRIEHFFSTRIDDFDNTEILDFHSCLMSRSEHPLSQLLLSWLAKYRNIDFPRVEDNADPEDTQTFLNRSRRVARLLLPPILYSLKHRIHARLG